MITALFKDNKINEIFNRNNECMFIINKYYISLECILKNYQLSNIQIIELFNLLIDYNVIGDLKKIELWLKNQNINVSQKLRDILRFDYIKSKINQEMFL